MKRRAPVLLACALVAVACASMRSASEVDAPKAAPAPATVPSHRPGAPSPKVGSGRLAHDGSEAVVACMTCHATRRPEPANGEGGRQPVAFHPGLRYAHGSQSCLSCHNAADYDSLRRADGRAVPFAEAQLLCGQCHGSQTRDYLHGSHGGMNGYWDTSRGPRTRNTCTDCHDPHAPAYPSWTPVFAPRDAAALQQAAREGRHNSEHP